MNSNRSSNASRLTPKDWQHVNLLHDGDLFKLTTGIFNSMIGWQTCAAAGIKTAEKLGISEALIAGAKLEVWLAKQNSQEKKKSL